MYMMDYKFAVLNSAFVVHRGFKEKADFHVSREEENTANRELYERFKLEMKERYPNTDKYC